jgi:hypothetical protein
MQTRVVRELNACLSSRDVGAFRRGLLRGTNVALGGALLRVGYSFLQARLTWKWRVKLTRAVHERYFTSMNYYLLGAGAKAGSPDQLSDLDTRYSTPPRQSSHATRVLVPQCFMWRPRVALTARRVGRGVGERCSQSERPSEVKLGYL